MLLVGVRLGVDQGLVLLTPRRIELGDFTAPFFAPHGDDLDHRRSARRVHPLSRRQRAHDREVHLLVVAASFDDAGQCQERGFEAVDGSGNQAATSKCLP